jgi:hypothetical protein
VKSYISSCVVVPLVETPVSTLVHAAPSFDTWRSKRFCRALPLYTPIFT